MFLAFVVFIGAGIGGVLRYLVSLAAIRWIGLAFPWGTFAVNVSGSFLMGILAAIFLSRAGNGGIEPWRLLLAVGVLGGYTTFSSFALDAVYLWERGSPTASVAYVFGSVLLSLAAVLSGLWLVRTIAG